MKKVLVVDDSIIVFENMKHLLANTDFQVEGYANSAENALQEYELLQPDLVTMDIILPGMDGIDATREITKKWPDAKVLVVSSLAYADTQKEAVKAGAKGFIYKPFTKEELLDALDALSADEQ